MKKLAILMAAFMISATSFAQIGITGGLTTSATNLKEATEVLKTKSVYQYHVGLVYKIPLGSVFTLQPGVIYNVKGGKFGTDRWTATMDYKTGYIEVPVQLQAGASLGSAVRLYGIAEPFLGYAVSNLYEFASMKKTDWDNVNNRFEVGASLGAGVELFKHFQVNLKYFWNFGQVYDMTALEEMATSAPSGISLSAVVTL